MKIDYLDLIILNRFLGLLIFIIVVFLMGRYAERERKKLDQDGENDIL